MSLVTDPQRITKTTSPISLCGPNDFPGYTSLATFYDPSAEDRVKARLNELRSLSVDWDGYGAAAPIGEVVDAVEQFCRRSISIPNTVINPTCDGGIQLEWLNGSKRLEIEFSPDGTRSFVRWDSDPATATEGELPVLTGSDPSAVRRFEEAIQELLSWLK